MSDAQPVEVKAPTCPNCGAPLELLGDSTCRWCHVLVERERPVQVAQPAAGLGQAAFGGGIPAPWTAETVDLGDYRSYSEPFAALFGWVDTFRQPPAPTGLGAGGAMYEFVRQITRIREHIGRVSGVAWDDRSIPRAVRDELESYLLALLDLVQAMSANAARDQQVRESGQGAVREIRGQLGRKFQADPKRIRKTFDTFPALATWVEAALS